MTQLQGNVLTELSDALAGAVDKAGRHVVAVSGRRRGPASGVHWRSGLIVTTDHVLEREEGITVAVEPDQKIPATIKGRDPTTDLAVLAVDAGSLGPAADLDGAGPLVVGRLVLAIGRAQGLSVSFGAVSAIGGPWRTWGGGRIDQLIKPDLTFYPGFSGGPLVEASGRIAGINTSGLSRGSSLTIPVTTVNRVVDQLLQSGRIARGYLGVRMQPVSLPDSLKARLNLPTATGLLIVSVETEGPSHEAGLLVGDILIEIAGFPVSDPAAVQSVLDPETVGKPVDLRIVRGGEETHVAVRVGERPYRQGRRNGQS